MALLAPRGVPLHLLRRQLLQRRRLSLCSPRRQQGRVRKLWQLLIRALAQLEPAAAAAAARASQPCCASTRCRWVLAIVNRLGHGHII